MKKKITSLLLLIIITFCSNTLSAQVTISGSTLNESTNYSSLHNAFMALNATAANSQVGRNIVIRITRGAGTSTNSQGLEDRGWTHLTVEGYSAHLFIIDEDTPRPVYIDGANNVTIKNLNMSTPTGNGLHITNGSQNINVDSCFFSINTGRAVYLDGQANNKITNFTCSNSTFVTGRNAVAFYLEHTDNVNINGNVMKLGGTSGIFFATGNSNFTLKNNDVTNNSGAGFFGANPVNIANTATNVLIQNNNFFDLLRESAPSEVIYCSDNATETLIIEGNSFYETQPIELHDSWSRYIYIGYNDRFEGGNAIKDLRVKNNYFGGTAPKCGGNVMSLGVNAVGRHLICIQTSTFESNTMDEVCNVDSIVGNRFAKIAMTTTSSFAPIEGNEDKRGALTAYFCFRAGRPVIEDNIVEDITLTGVNNNVHLTGFGHSGEEPVFKRNVFRNLTVDNDGRYAGNINAICIGNVNVSGGGINTAESKLITFQDNLFDGLYATSASTSNLQQVIAIRFDRSYQHYEGHTEYINNTVQNLENQATGNYSNIVAGFYSNTNTNSYHKLYSHNKFDNLTLAGAGSWGISTAIYYNAASSARVTSNDIRNISVGGGMIYGIYSPQTENGDTIANNIISSLYNSGMAYSWNDLDDQSCNTAAIFAAGNSLKVIKGNTIKQLGNSASGFSGSTIGINVHGSEASVISENFISDIANVNDDSFTVGLYSFTSVKVFSNNIVSLDNNNKASGLMNRESNYQPASHCYFNTFRIKSTMDSSFGYYGASSSAIVKNNIFDIQDKGYGFYSLVANSNATHNNAFALNGTPFHNADDNNISIRPKYVEKNVFVNIEDFIPLNTSLLEGIYISDIITDIGGNMRGIPPTMGAWEINIFPDENNIIYVDMNVSGGIRNGSSWENATRNLSNALLWARANKDNGLWDNANPLKIYVAIGNYTPLYSALDEAFAANGDRENAFVLVKDVQLYGGFDPANNIKTPTDIRKFGNSPATGTVLSGDIGNIDDPTDNTYHVVIGAADLGIASMDGFTIQDGYRGLVDSGSIYVNGCVVRYRDGAGIFLVDIGTFELSNTTVRNNLSFMLGGGIFVQDNDGGTVVNIRDCVIQGNTAGFGGGIMAATAQLNLTNVMIAGNIATSYGGGIANVMNATGIYTNVLIYDNVAETSVGGGLYASESTVHLTNATITRNKATEGSSLATENNAEINVRNSIIWQHDGYGGHIAGTITNFTKTLLENGVVDGTDIVTNVAPLFINPSINDFRLHFESPALRVGNVNLYNNGMTPDISYITVDIAGCPRISYNTVDLGAYQMGYNRWTGVINTDWDTAENWELNQVLVENDDLVFIKNPSNDLAIKEGELRQVASIYNRSENNRKIDIHAGGSLQVTSADIDIESAAHLHIRAAEGKLNGTFITPANVPIEATVEMYSKAISDDSATKMSELVWQYFGTPVDNYLVEHMGVFVIRSHNEHLDKWWTTLKNGDRLSVFKGYEISRQLKVNNIGLVTFRGNLINSDQTIPLSYTSGVAHLFKGQHIISNPYTAALSIKDGLEFDDATDATVYFYHTGSRADWLANSGGDGSTAGQYYAVPQANADDMPAEYQYISSMQGFLVRTNGATDGSVKFKYEAGTVKNNVAMRSKGTQEFNKKVMTIDLTTANGVQMDKMWLFVNEDATRGFDNGYDGRKMFGESTLAHIYSPEEDGDYQVNTIPDINGTYLSFKAEAGISDYVLKFNHKNADKHMRLQLLDLENSKLTDISADCAEYAFTATNETTTQKRFKLLISNEIADGNDEDVGVYLYQENDKLFVVNRNNERITVTLYDITGHALICTQPNDNELIVINTPSHAGIYVAKIYSEMTKKTMVRKIVAGNHQL